MDLCREILLKIEESEEDEIIDIQIDGYSENEIKYNCKLLNEANFIKSYQDFITGQFAVGELTWTGSEFLDGIRENSFWNSIKDYIKKNGVQLTFSSISKVIPILQDLLEKQ